MSFILHGCIWCSNKEISANDHCLGGSIIWSLDQDDGTYRYATWSSRFLAVFVTFIAARYRRSMETLLKRSQVASVRVLAASRQTGVHKAVRLDIGIRGI